jgi:hypothetical protein
MVLSCPAIELGKLAGLVKARVIKHIVESARPKQDLPSGANHTTSAAY